MAWLVTALLGAFVTTASAQSISGETVWAAVAYINNGERTPLTGTLNTVLTPEGAQQMVRQGTAFRARYLRNGVSNGSTFGDEEKAYIQGININVIDNSILDVEAQADEWIAGSAMAFMQGLYPPAADYWDSNTGGSDIAMDYPLGTDNETNYPLNGYQYPFVQTPSYLDEDSTYLSGTDRCSNWVSQVRYNLTTDTYLAALYNSTWDFYQELFSTAPLVGTVGLDEANFWNAYDIYDLVNYMYIHNETVYNNLADANGTISRLGGYAVELERAKNSFPDISRGINEEYNVLYTIAGRTLATKVVENLLGAVAWGGSADKLTLLFGDYTPILSFASLADLLTAETMAAGPFNEIPQPGAALVFELYSEESDEDTSSSETMPDVDDLLVRFYYRDSADEDAEFQIMALFGDGANATNMSYTGFIETMEYLARTPVQWCDICGNPPSPWCSANVTTISASCIQPITPPVAGVIGAVATLALAALVMLLLALFGFRIQRDPERSLAVGGFKGAEKKAADPDVAVTRTGAHHERSGSWELKNGAKGPPAPETAAAGGIVTKDLSQDQARPIHDDEDDEDLQLVGAVPVKAHETV